MIRNCNNCDVDHCKGNGKSYCNNHRAIVSRVKFRDLISKVSIPKNRNVEAALYLLKDWM